MSNTVEELLEDTERVMLMSCAVDRLAKTNGETDRNTLLNLISRISGTDTQLIVRRAYPSRVARKQLR
jgi:hypothetical protein